MRHPNIKLLADKAQAALRIALSDGDIRAGQFLSMSELSEFLDCPIASIRDAVKWASAQGLLTTLPKRGVQVMELRPKIIRDCLDFSLMFDQEGVRRRLASGDLSGLDQTRAQHENVVEQATAIDQNAPLARMALAAELSLHDHLATGLANPLLLRAYEANKLRTAVIKNAQPFPKDSILASMQERLAVIDALEAHQTQTAVEALHSHYQNTARRWGLPEG